MNNLPPKSEMERAAYEQDASYDGVFFVAVRTTNIFCRPSCQARKPLAENIVFYASAREALFAGYRPCKRCQPLLVNGRPPEWVERLLATIERAPQERIRDENLRAMGINPARARRYFLKHYGLTFQAYCRGRRLGEALKQIRQGASLDDVALGNGYESHSGFRDAFGKTFGLPPGKSQNVDCVLTGLAETPLGALVIGATSAGVCLVEFTDRRMLEAQFATLRRLFRCAIVPGNNQRLDQLRRELAGYFAGELTEFQVPLVYPGSEFQRTVWSALQQIPYGETRSYEDMARGIGKSSAVRAVGTANGLNRIAILIPCHRLVNKNGQLGGYGGGLWRKRALLDLERRAAGKEAALNVTVYLA